MVRSRSSAQTKAVRAMKGLSSLPIVFANEPSKFCTAANGTLGLWDEVFIEHGVVATDTPVRSLFVIVAEPLAVDIVQLLKAEADKVIQNLALHAS